MRCWLLLCFPWDLGVCLKTRELPRIQPHRPCRRFPRETKPIRIKKAALPTQPLITVKATVQAVDADRRVVTLKDPKGELLDLKVEEDVESLSQVKIGDKVVTKYYGWAAVRMAKEGKPMQEVMKTFESKAEPGNESVGVTREPQTVTATIEKIDHPRTHVTIRHPDGRAVKIFIRSPRVLRDVKVGDSVLITYIEALAFSMEKVK